MDGLTNRGGASGVIATERSRRPARLGVLSMLVALPLAGVAVGGVVGATPVAAATSAQVTHLMDLNGASVAYPTHGVGVDSKSKGADKKKDDRHEDDHSDGGKGGSGGGGGGTGGDNDQHVGGLAGIIADLGKAVGHVLGGHD